MAKKAKKAKKASKKKSRRKSAQQTPPTEMQLLLAKLEDIERRLVALEVAVTRIPRSYPYPQPQPQSPDAPTWPQLPTAPWSPTWQPKLPPWNGNDNVFKS